jgi:hypothetical protein
LRPSGAPREHGAQDALDLYETQFEFGVPLATQMSAQGIVLGHSTNMTERPGPVESTPNTASLENGLEMEQRKPFFRRTAAL